MERDAKGRFLPKSSTIGYKGFDLDFRCRDKQYTVGQITCQSGPLQLCSNGLHFCSDPLDVLAYYNPSNSRYGIVKALGGVSSRSIGDSKQCTNKLRVEQELDISDFCALAFAHHCKNTTKTADIPSMEKPHFFVKSSFINNKDIEISAYDARCLTGVATIGITLDSNSISRAAGCFGIAIARGACSIASADIAIVTGPRSIARSDSEIGLAYCGSFGHAVTTRRSSVAVSLCNTAAITLCAKRSIGILAGGTAHVKDTGCILVIRRIELVNRLYLVDGTAVVIEADRDSQQQEPLMLIAGKDLKHKKNLDYYTALDLRRAYDKKLKGETK